MGRVININGIGKERQRLLQAVTIAIRELMQQPEPDQTTRDLAAFISLELAAIYQTVDTTVAAWEKRGYWLKADRFRLDWDWCNTSSNQLKEATLTENWTNIALITARITEKLNSVKFPKKPILDKPWLGAWDKIQKKQ